MIFQTLGLPVLPLLNLFMSQELDHVLESLYNRRESVHDVSLNLNILPIPQFPISVVCLTSGLLAWSIFKDNHP